MKYINEFNCRWVRCTSLVLVCLFLANGNLLADPPSDGSEKPPAQLPADEGLTRDSLNDPSLQAPATSAVKAAAATRTTLDRSGARPLAHHRRHHRHHLKPAQEPPVVAIHARPRRHPVVRFVYWWNGWVIRKFHTHIGTVLLGTVGAET